jgi:hypothetical protein
MYNVRLFRIVTTNPLLYKEYILKKNEQKKKKKAEAQSISYQSGIIIQRDHLGQKKSG